MRDLNEQSRENSILVIDNYDSFTYNIVQYLKIIGVSPLVIKNDELSLNEINKLSFSRIIISPGWGTPENSGVTMQVLDFYKDRMPILGVCLGMQCIARYFGAGIIRAPEPCHGKNSAIYFKPDFPLFRGMRQGFSATRYHSLVVDSPTDIIDITAWTEEHLPMALKIRGKDIYGVQFHPEAYLTEQGMDIFRNFISCTA